MITKEECTILFRVVINRIKLAKEREARVAGKPASIAWLVVIPIAHILTPQRTAELVRANRASQFHMIKERGNTINGTIKATNKKDTTRRAGLKRDGTKRARTPKAPTRDMMIGGQDTGVNSIDLDP